MIAPIKDGSASAATHLSGEIARLAGLTNVISALLGAISIMDPHTHLEALQTCASMAADVADDLETLTLNTGGVL